MKSFLMKPLKDIVINKFYEVHIFIWNFWKIIFVSINTKYIIKVEFQIKIDERILTFDIYKPLFI